MTDGRALLRNGDGLVRRGAEPLGFPTPFYDERPSKVFIARGGAHGLTSEPALTLSGAPGYGVAFTAGD